MKRNYYFCRDCERSSTSFTLGRKPSSSIPCRCGGDLRLYHSEDPANPSTYADPRLSPSDGFLTQKGLEELVRQIGEAVRIPKGYFRSIVESWGRANEEVERARAAFPFPGTINCRSTIIPVGDGEAGIFRREARPIPAKSSRELELELGKLLADAIIGPELERPEDRAILGILGKLKPRIVEPKREIRRLKK